MGRVPLKTTSNTLKISSTGLGGAKRAATGIAAGIAGAGMGAGIAIVAVISIAVTFGLAIYQLVAASMFVRPLFQDAHKQAGSGRYTLAITTNLAKVLKAFTVIYWVILGLSVLSMIDSIKTHKAQGATQGTTTPHAQGLMPTSIVGLALTVLFAVGVGFLTAKIWKAPQTPDKKHVVLNLSATQLVFIKISIVGEIVMSGLFFALLVISMLVAGSATAMGAALAHL